MACSMTRRYPPCAVKHRAPQPPCEKQINYRHVSKRTWRDVAIRYIRIYDGTTFAVKTDFDDIEIFLKNATGEVIASVSMLNRFAEPKPTGLDNRPF